MNMIRGLLAEFGVAFLKGVEQALALARRVAEGESQELPALAAGVVKSLAEQVLQGHERVRKLDRELLAWHRSSELARRIATVPGVGLIGTTRWPPQSPTLPNSVRAASSPLGLGCTPAALQRRKGAAGAHLQDGRPIPATAADHGHDLSGTAQHAPSRSGGPEDQRPAGAQAVAGGHCRHGQPGGPGDLGHHGVGRGL